MDPKKVTLSKEAAEATAKPKPAKVAKAPKAAAEVAAPVVVETAEVEALQAEANAQVAVEAAAPAAPKGKQVYLITLRERDEIMADDDAPKGVKTLLEGGVEVRRSNGGERPASIPQILPQYYSRWALRLTLTDKQAETLGSWTDLDAGVEVGEAKPRKSGGGTTDVEKESLIAARSLVQKIDAMPAPEAVKAMATDEAQEALDTIHKGVARAN